MSDDSPVRRRRRNPEQTRKAIVDALLSAMKERQAIPTAKDIAARAGVSERSVFVHFAGLDDLSAAATEAQSEYVESLVATVDAALPLEERIAAVVAQSAEIFAAQRHPRLYGLMESNTMPAVDARMRLTDKRIREALARVFEPELTRDGAPDGELLDLIEATAGWAFRHHLMDRRGLPQQAASRAITRALGALFADNAPRH
ncbi:TetR/AcrR family transcriptional regulator [Nocardia sp. NPDC020380]|uniref:TetR/AcrR family transcriptional regulator n=1 Tax=Nocardia sp. NPDC020380 TaxID=3364309 RepID=UPI00379B9146